MSARSIVTKWLGLVVAIALISGAGWWAGRATLSDRDQSSEQWADRTAWAEASETEVGRSLALTTTVRQPTNVVAANVLPGVVREAHEGMRNQGEILYVVNDVPVRAVQADLPFWRDISYGTHGDDVAALQQALIDLGYLNTAVDGNFGNATLTAVKHWQKDLSQNQTGTIGHGELVAFKSLPVSVELSESIAPGTVLSGGEEAVMAPTGERTFVVVVASYQSELIPSGATVDVRYEEYEWQGIIVERVENIEGNFDLILQEVDGGEVCGSDCDVLPADSYLPLASKVNIVPEVAGVGVPAMAVQTRPSGETYVVTEDGEIDVVVAGSGQGIVIVDGITSGTRVELPVGASNQADQQS